MKKMVYILMLGIVAGLYFGCSDDDKSSTKPTPDTVLKVTVHSRTDSAAVINSNVVVYEAETSQAVVRDLTNDEGSCYFLLDEGNYYLEVTAQGYDPSPAPNVTPVPFFVTPQDTTELPYYLNFNPVENSIYIKGFVEPVVNNCLIQAIASSGTEKYSSISGPDGFFILYNIQPDNYSYEALKSGFKLDTVLVTNVVSPEAIFDSLTVYISPYLGSSMSGSLSFIAGAEAKPTDMVLRDPVSLKIIPGMVTMADTTGGNNDYSFENIPDGDFILWASLANDHNVMDPDKNLGGIDVSFPNDNGLIKSIDITGCINIIGPTNPMDSIYAFVADSIVPTFSWAPYSSTQEYIIEVRDLSGNILWGGFNQSDSTINHGYIDDAVTSVVYNFDGSASQALVPGEIYQWSLWADKGTHFDSVVEQLISASEDLMGIFQVPSEIPLR